MIVLFSIGISHSTEKNNLKFRTELPNKREKIGNGTRQEKKRSLLKKVITFLTNDFLFFLEIAFLRGFS